MANTVVRLPISKLNHIFLTGTYITFKRFVLVIVLIVIVLYTSISIGHAHTSPLVIELAPHLLPGNPAPENVQCGASDMARAQIKTCSVYQNGFGTVHVIYDSRARVLIHTSYIAQALTIGDFIEAWGSPDSYALNDYTAPVTVFLFWNKKAASVAIPVNEDSPVSVVAYYWRASDFPFPRYPWHGFGELDRR